jgi:hypothetical protein
MEKIGQIFEHSLKKNQLFISKSSGGINFLMKPCNPPFLCGKNDRSKTITDKC